MEKEILKILKNNQNEYISGQKISESLNVSRMTISSCIKKLKEKGYHIISSTKKGYCLTEDNDIILIENIKSAIPDFFQNIKYFDEMDSTNDYLKRTSHQQGDIVIAQSQTKGKGRNGKSFYSPQQKGIYVSFVLKPDLTIYDSLKITACLAVSLVKAIEKNYPVHPQIKWVNDIMIHDFKIAGILCEASLEMNTAQIEQMIVGIGINVHSYSMPDYLQNIAACIEDFCSIKASREQLLIDFFNIFYQDYLMLSTLSWLDFYRQHSYILHQDITVYENNKAYPAYVLDINDDASLKIQSEQGVKNLSSGEISIRKRTSS